MVDKILQVFEMVRFTKKTTRKEFEKMVDIHEFISFVNYHKVKCMKAYIGIAGKGLVEFQGYFKNETKKNLLDSFYKECIMVLDGNFEAIEDEIMKFRLKYGVTFNT